MEESGDDMLITGSAASPEGPAPGFIRISYNLDDTAQLTEGIRRLGVLLREMKIAKTTDEEDEGSLVEE